MLITNNSELPSRVFDDLVKNINKYCDNLTHFGITGKEPIYEEIQKKFSDKFGPKLISLETVNTFDSHLYQTKFNRLKSVRIEINQLDLFKLFIENNLNTLKYLDINIKYININSCKINKKENVEMLLKIITISKNLIHLGIEINFELFDESFIDYWNEIAINCKQIKSLKLYFLVKQNMRLNDEILSILKQFKRLKRLDLRLYYISLSERVSYYPIKYFNGFEGLTHFSFELGYFHNPMVETFLEDIDIIFPKLEYFTINYPFIASEWTAQMLSKISSLKTIELRIENFKIIPQIERQLTNNCKHFSKFSLIYNK